MSRENVATRLRIPANGVAFVGLPSLEFVPFEVNGSKIDRANERYGLFSTIYPN